MYKPVSVITVEYSLLLMILEGSGRTSCKNSGSGAGLGIIIGVGTGVRVGLAVMVKAGACEQLTNPTSNIKREIVKSFFVKRFKNKKVSKKDITCHARVGGHPSYSLIDSRFRGNDRFTHSFLTYSNFSSIYLVPRRSLIAVEAVGPAKDQCAIPVPQTASAAANWRSMRDRAQ